MCDIQILIVCILNMFFFINGSIFNSLLIHTSFKNISDLKDEVMNSSFFKEYLKIINAENIEFNPPILENKLITFPQEIKYRCRPSIPILPKHIGKMDIHQKWFLDDCQLHGEVNTNMISFNVKVIPIDNNKCISIIFQGDIIKKNFFVPSTVIKDVLLDIENIFKEILEKDNEK